MNKNIQLREERLVFYTDDVERINSELDAFLELSSARCALLVDSDGHMVTRRGEPIATQVEAIAALIAGSFAATKEMARLLGEEQFTTLFHQGNRESIQISLVSDRSLLGIVFDDRTNLGLVRFYAQETTRRLEEILVEIAASKDEPGGDQLSDDFSSSAAAALDELF